MLSFKYKLQDLKITWEELMQTWISVKLILLPQNFKIQALRYK